MCCRYLEFVPLGRKQVAQEESKRSTRSGRNEEKMTQDRLIFDYLDCSWSINQFDLDKIPNMSMEYIRKLCTGVHQLNLSEEYIEFTRETR